MLIEVEVAYAKPDIQLIVRVKTPKQSTALEIIKASGLLQQFPEIDLQINKVGIFAGVCRLDQIPKQGDRIEIYRPLIHDPKEARRQRAVKK